MFKKFLSHSLKRRFIHTSPCLNQSTTEFTLLNVEKKDPYILDKIEVFNKKDDVNLQLNDTNKITSNLDQTYVSK